MDEFEKRATLSERSIRLIGFACFAFFLLSQVIITPSASHAATSWAQTDWSGGSGQTSWSSSSQFSSSSGFITTVANQVTLNTTSGWYDSHWAYRKKITFDNSSQAENLINFPVLVALTTQNFDFSKTQSAGQDLRFIDTDGSTVLNYEIESYNTATSTASVWVKVPQIDASSATDYIYMYYGNPTATAGQNITSTWNANFLSVLHLKETGNGTTSEFGDSTSNVASGTGGAGDSTKTPAATSSGKVGTAQSFDGTNDFLDLGDLTATEGATKLTLSAWVNQTALAGSQCILCKFNSNNTQASWFLKTWNGSGALVAGIARTTVDGNTWVNTVDGVYTAGAWNQIVFVYDGTQSASSDKFKIYVNGVVQSIGQYKNATATSILATTSNATVGAMSNQTQFMSGGMDEVRISNNARSAAWTLAEYKTESGSYSTYATEESYYATPGTLTSSIFDGQYAGGSAWNTLAYTASTPSGTTVAIKARTSNSATMSGATDFTSCTAITNGANASSSSCVTNGDKYIQYQLILSNTNGSLTPTFTAFSLGYSAYDQVAPSSFSITSPQNNSYSSNPLQTVAWTASTDDRSGLAKYQLVLDDVVFVDNLSTSSTSYTFTSPLNEGIHTVKINAVDTIGNVASTPATTITIDTLSPTSFAIASPTVSTPTNSSTPTITWNASVDTGSGIAKYQVRVDGALALDNIASAATSATLSTALKEGSHVVQVIAFDMAGNNISSANSTFTVDLTKPVGSIMLTNPSSTLLNVRASLTAADPTSNDVSSGIVSMRLGEHADLSKIAWETFATNKDWTLSQKDSALYAQFKDAAGNESSVVSANTASPALSLSSFGTVSFNSKFDHWYYTGHRIPFSGIAAPGATVLITIHSDPISCETTADSTGKWSCTPNSDIPNGEHTVAIQTISTSGNYNSASFTLSVNTGLALTGTYTPFLQLLGMLLSLMCGLFIRRAILKQY